MFIFIPIPLSSGSGHRYTATVQGVVWKLVHCEQCESPYAYRLQVEGSGSSGLHVEAEKAEQQATSAAQRQLAAACRQQIAAVPCPTGGHYQRDMIPLVRRTYFHWTQLLGAILLAVAASLGILLPDALIPAVTVGVIGLALFASGLNRRRRFDPNAGDPSSRQRQGRLLTIWGDELLRLLAERGLGATPPRTDARPSTADVRIQRPKA